MASATSAARWTQSSRENAPLDVIEIDPQLAVSLGFIQGDTVSQLSTDLSAKNTHSTSCS